MPDWLVYIIFAIALLAASASVIGHAANWMGWL